MTGFDPDYGFPENFRREVIKTARQHGAKIAASKHNVAITTVYKYIQKEKENVSANKTCCLCGAVIIN